MAEYDTDKLREKLSYNAKTGVLRWRGGDIAGCLNSTGYRVIRMDKKLMYAHRIAWVLHYGIWPDGDLDHKNRDKSDNRIANLRMASRSRNVANAPARGSLPKGCYQLKGRSRWYSQIVVDGKVKRLGTFPTQEAAAAAFKREHRVVHGGFSHCEAR
jgi:HNH endonuclease